MEGGDSAKQTTVDNIRVTAATQRKNMGDSLNFRNVYPVWREPSRLRPPKTNSPQPDQRQSGSQTLRGVGEPETGRQWTGAAIRQEVKSSSTDSQRGEASGGLSGPSKVHHQSGRHKGAARRHSPQPRHSNTTPRPDKQNPEVGASGFASARSGPLPYLAAMAARSLAISASTISSMRGKPPCAGDITRYLPLTIMLGVPSTP